MANYNAYIEKLATRKKAFFAELQRMEFFSEYSRAIIKMENDFA